MLKNYTSYDYICSGQTTVLNQKVMDSQSLPNEIQKQLYGCKFDKAMTLLSKFLAKNDARLFDVYDDAFMQDIGYLRIQLLLRHSYYREALAWACLDCELHPENKESLFLKERIKEYMAKTPNASTPNSKPLAEFNVNWGNLAGMSLLKSNLTRDVILPYYHKNVYIRKGIRIPRGMIFYGPPGCGKTMVIRQLATILKFNLKEITPADIGSTYIHGTQLRIKELFEEASKKVPAMLFFDEFDAVAPSRQNSGVHHHYHAEVSELLKQFEDAYDKGIFVVAATNYINNIDPSVLRPGRFDKKIYVGPPDYEARIDTFKMYLRKVPHSIKHWDYVGDETENYNYAEIRLTVDEAIRTSEARKQILNLDHLMLAIKENPAKLNSVKLSEYM